MNILLVEDHDALAEISCSQLREHYDHVVTHVSNGRAALETIERVCPDLVLLDLNLPDMTGYEVAQQLRRDPRWNGTVFVALSGFGAEIDRALASESGIDAHFRKPMDFSVLSDIKRRSAKS